jgi:hypothetical protein
LLDSSRLRLAKIYIVKAIFGILFVS